ncbi:MAG TPA: PHB depolymerase family esterase [Polyangia bacterium]|jgi:polyhydroxybutyrate depolymerase
MRVLVLLVALALGCGRGAPAPGSAPVAQSHGPAAAARGPASAAAPPPRVLGGARPATIVAPAGPARGVLLSLHGYGDDGPSFAAGLGLPALAARAGFVLVTPDGTPDAGGDRFWNATEACCDFGRVAVDDVAYLTALAREAAAAYGVPPGRVYALGLSNGGFMAHRLACDAADDFAAVVSIAGTTFADPARCRPRSPVSLLQVSPDADRVVSYAGGADLLGRGGAPYPGAEATFERWARLDGCRGPRRAEPAPLDLDRAVPGPETRVALAAGCPDGVDVRLWTLHGSAHVPSFGPAFAERAWEWLAAHPKRR